MDFSPIALDDETIEFANEFHAWLDEHVSDDLIENEWDRGEGHLGLLYSKLGSRRWAHPALPEDEGGAGLDELHCRIIELELLAHRVPVTTRDTTALVLPAVRTWITPPLRGELIGKAARGEMCICLGYTEPGTGSDLASVETRAVQRESHWVITGQKMFTTGAQHCDYCFLLARTDPDAPKHRGLTTFLVPLRTKGIEIRRVQTLGGELTNMVFFDEVEVSDAYRMGAAGDGWTVVNGPLDDEHRLGGDGAAEFDEQPGEAGEGRGADLSAHILRVHEPAVRATVEWAQEGAPGERPIDDPMVRARLAEIELGLILSKIIPGPQGRVAAADSMIRNTSDLMDLLGPNGLIPRRHAGSAAGGWPEYAHRFAQACAIYGGTTEVIRNLIAQRFLGLGKRR